MRKWSGRIYSLIIGLSDSIFMTLIFVPHTDLEMLYKDSRAYFFQSCMNKYTSC